MACPLAGGREVEQNQVQLHPLDSLDFLGSDPLIWERAEQKIQFPSLKRSALDPVSVWCAC